MSLKGLYPCLTENLKHAEFRVAFLLTGGYWAFQNALIPKYFSLLDPEINGIFTLCGLCLAVQWGGYLM